MRLFISLSILLCALTASAIPPQVMQWMLEAATPKASASGSSPSFVQVTNIGFDFNSTTITNPSITVTAGNSIIVFSEYGSTATCTVTDSLANVYHAIGAPNIDGVNGQEIQMLIATNIAGGADVITNYFTASVYYVRSIVVEVSGTLKANVVDQNSYTNGAPVSSVFSITNMTPGFSYETILAVAMQEGAAIPDPTTASGWTSPLGSLCKTGDSAMLFEYQQVSTTASVLAKFGLTSGNGIGACVGIRSQ